MEVIGLLLQMTGTIFLTIPIWGKPFASWFSTEDNMWVDKRHWFPKIVIVGLIFLVLGYSISISVVVN